MFEFNGKEYDLKYNIKRVELIEAALNSSIMSSLAANKGYLSIQQIKTHFAFALKEAGSDVFVKPKEGQEIAEALIEGTGYEITTAQIIEALQRDCPFFFQGV